MRQINKIYLASFLKNQTYFVPIIVLFFQDLGLNFSQIFWIFTIGSIFSFVIEIPTGIFADLYGKRKSIILSKLFIFISFVFFGFAFNFLTLLLANLIYELGKSFRSGTETAYVYDYLAENKDNPSYVYVKTNQKFYARISESVGTAFGGFIAYKLGFNIVFFVAAVPAFLNFLQTLSWQHLLEEGERKINATIVSNIIFAKNSIKEVFVKPQIRKIVFNISLFASAFFALDKFTQPYMKGAGIELQYFGLIYSGFLLLIAFLARSAARLEEKFGAIKIMNYLSLIAVIPLLILGFGHSSYWGVGFFFFVMLVENIRSPIANALFHDNVSSTNRATMGSILQLFESSSKLIVLPVIGYLADLYSMSFAILIIGGLVILNSLLFWIPQDSRLAKKI